MDKNGQKGHRERLKERFIKGGVEGLADYEILELLLFYSIPYRDCKPYAKDIIKRYGSISSFLEADEEMMEIEGIKNNTFILTKLIKEILRIYIKETKIEKKRKIGSTKEVIAYLNMEMSLSKKEIFKVIFLNTQNEFICDENLFTGTLDKNFIYPREIIEKVIKYNAKSIIFAHNHPSGTLIPSEADKTITYKLKQILKEIDVNLLDHIIIGGDKYYSFLEEGIL